MIVEESNFRKDESSMRHVEAFLIRRLIFALIIVFLVEMPFFQIQGLLYMQMFYIIYLGLSRPLASNEDNNADMVNESLLMLQVYHIIWFTDFVNEPNFKYAAGWSSVCVTLLQILMNLFRMGYKSVKESIASYRK